MSRAVVVAALLGASASPVPALLPTAAQPALGVFPANATRVTAQVRKVSGHTLTLEIQDARPARSDQPMGPAAGTIEAVSPEPLPAGLAGRRIEATVTLVGDTQASRWLVSEIRTLP